MANAELLRETGKWKIAGRSRKAEIARRHEGTNGPCQMRNSKSGLGMESRGSETRRGVIPLFQSRMTVTNGKPLSGHQGKIDQPVPPFVGLGGTPYQ
jgi:hypothetical protein